MHKKILIIGNSGSGKSSLAKLISQSESIVSLDLDTYAWTKSSPPQRVPAKEAIKKIQNIIMEIESWVIEGCYTDLLDLLSPQANELIYLNLPIELCIENAKKRPWEPHKFDSKNAQDKKLKMLIDWISQYETRDDVFSQKTHLKFYDSFTNKKQMYTKNIELEI
jgi:adenylate kinase family enzyme